VKAVFTVRVPATVAAPPLAMRTVLYVPLMVWTGALTVRSPTLTAGALSSTV